VSAADPIGVDEMLAQARAELDRVDPIPASESVASGRAALVDIRTETQVAGDGRIPGAWLVGRNVLEWRLDPRSPDAIEQLARQGLQVIVVCDEGYTSSLAAASARRLGVDATDLVGGFQAWRAAGLPVVGPGE
jgi:rhodanese-related sulfurtransferase